MALIPRHRCIALLSAAMLLLAQGMAQRRKRDLGAAPPAPAEGARQLRGQRHLSAGGGPRVNRRRSTIPGVSNPDHGRPPVIVIKPLAKPATPGFRTFGGNTGIFGNP